MQKNLDPLRVSRKGELCVVLPSFGLIFETKFVGPSTHSLSLSVSSSLQGLWAKIKYFGLLHVSRMEELHCFLPFS